MMSRAGKWLFLLVSGVAALAAAPGRAVDLAKLVAPRIGIEGRSASAGHYSTTGDRDTVHGTQLPVATEMLPAPLVVAHVPPGRTQARGGAGSQGSARPEASYALVVRPPRLVARVECGSWTSHVVAATGDRLPFFPTAPPLDA